jgi:hypothetical protein
MSMQDDAAAETEAAQALRLLARVPRLRVLAWHDRALYASRGYEVLRAVVNDGRVDWQSVGRYRSPAWRLLTSKSRLASRFVRDGFHALTVTPRGTLIGAVPGAIVTLEPGQSEFVIGHRISRGTRPLHVTATPDGHTFFGEYFSNDSREEVHIYGTQDEGRTWAIAYTFSRGAVRHVHNIVYDRFEHCLWIFTGDYGDECRILRASYDLKTVDTVMAGNQQARAVAAVVTAEGLYFASDTPLEANHVYRMSRDGTLTTLADLESSSIEGCLVGDTVVFSTMVEPSAANPSPLVSLYAGRGPESWRRLASWRKDAWSMRFFQYGNAFLPTGENPSDYLAVSTVAVQDDDLVTAIYKLQAAR